MSASCSPRAVRRSKRCGGSPSGSQRISIDLGRDVPPADRPADVPRGSMSVPVGAPMPPAAPARSHDRDGPLPHLLLVLTVGTGLLDAVSYLKFGHVFVANMTGNAIFLGFAVAGASDVSV